MYLIHLVYFYIYDESEKLVCILYEVKNTFGEQHTYIFKTKNNDNLLQHNCSKKFHVSPFIEMNCNYFFRLLKPSEKISVIIDQYQDNEKILYASQDGNRVNFTSIELIKSYLKHPLMTLKIILAIHFEAFKLWAKGIKFIKKKIKIKNNTMSASENCQKLRSQKCKFTKNENAGSTIFSERQTSKKTQITNLHFF